MAENIFPSHVLFNSTKKAVCIELRTGVTVAGILDKCDGWMNLVLHSATRYSADGQQEWKSDEVLIRGNAIKTIRVDPACVKAREVRPHQAAAPAQQGGDRGGRGRGGGYAANQAGQRRQRDDSAPKMTAEDRNAKFGGRGRGSGDRGRGGGRGGGRGRGGGGYRGHH